MTYLSELLIIHMFRKIEVFFVTANLEDEEESLHLNYLVACRDRPTQLKMYCTINLASVKHFDNWTNSVLPTVYLGITKKEQVLSGTLEDFSSDAFKTLKK